MRFTEQDYLNNLSEQIYFLKTSSEQFDKGHLAEAKRIASSIRFLLHDTDKSTSLLKHLNVKTKFYYFNTAIPNSKFGLTGIRTTSENGGRTEYYAPLENLSEKRKERPWVIFNSWWEDMIVLSDGERNFSRKKLVLTLANKDGGVHIDRKLPPDYYALTRNNTLNVFHVDKENKENNVIGIELASLRQIAFELVKSLEAKFPNL